jgi:hypothetical protein
MLALAHLQAARCSAVRLPLTPWHAEQVDSSTSRRAVLLQCHLPLRTGMAPVPTEIGVRTGKLDRELNAESPYPGHRSGATTVQEHARGSCPATPWRTARGIPPFFFPGVPNFLCTYFRSLLFSLLSFYQKRQMLLTCGPRLLLPWPI